MLGNARLRVAGLLLGSTLAAVTAAGTQASAATSAPVRPGTDAIPVSSTAQASAGVKAAAKGAGTDAAIRAYWTPARMKSAIPADLKVDKARAATIKAKGGVLSTGEATKIAGVKATTATPGAALRPSGVKALATSSAADWYGSYWSPPATTTGKVFFTAADGYGYVCSGSAVNSEAKNTVFTAGHCVSDGAGHFHSNWAFVPDYWYNYRPFGTWTARELWTLSNWHYSADFRYDVGAVVLNTDGYGNRLVNVVGGQGITWNQPVGLYTSTATSTAAAEQHVQPVLRQRGGLALQHGAVPVLRQSHPSRGRRRTAGAPAAVTRR